MLSYCVKYHIHKVVDESSYSISTWSINGVCSTTAAKTKIGAKRFSDELCHNFLHDIKRQVGEGATAAWKKYKLKRAWQWVKAVLELWAWRFTFVSSPNKYPVRGQLFFVQRSRHLISVFPCCTEEGSAKTYFMIMIWWKKFIWKIVRKGHLSPPAAQGFYVISA